MSTTISSLQTSGSSWNAPHTQGFNVEKFLESKGCLDLKKSEEAKKMKPKERYESSKRSKNYLDMPRRASEKRKDANAMNPKELQRNYINFLKENQEEWLRKGIATPDLTVI